MSYTIEDLIGAKGIINFSDRLITISVDNLVNADGEPFLPSNISLIPSVVTAERFLAAYFAYLNYRLRQRPVTITNEPSEGNTQEIPVDTIDDINQLDSSQGIVAQPIPIGNGVQQEIRNGVTQTRFDFWFSVYLENVVQFEPSKVV